MLNDRPVQKRITLTQAELNKLLASHERYLSGTGGLRAQLTHKTLDNLNLANRKLVEADFSGSSLVGANLFGSNLERASFYCADLRNCNLRSENLSRADLRGASFNGATLSRANLDNADLRAATMMFIGPDGVNVVGQGRGDRNDSATIRKAPLGVDFSNCSMKRVSFGSAKLDGADFSGALLQGANFKGAHLTNVTFKGAVMTGVSTKDLGVPPEALKDCVTDISADAMAKLGDLKARLDAHQTWLTSGGAQGGPANLDGEDLRPLHNLLVGRALTGLSARGTVAIGIDFSGCGLQAAKFEGADLRDSNFTQADLRGASLKKTKLAHAIFDKANLSGLHLANGAIMLPILAESDATVEQFHSAILEGDISSLGVTSC